MSLQWTSLSLSSRPLEETDQCHAAAPQLQSRPASLANSSVRPNTKEDFIRIIKRHAQRVITSLLGVMGTLERVLELADWFAYIISCAFKQRDEILSNRFRTRRTPSDWWRHHYQVVFLNYRLCDLYNSRSLCSMLCSWINPGPSSWSNLFGVFFRQRQTTSLSTSLITRTLLMRYRKWRRRCPTLLI